MRLKAHPPFDVAALTRALILSMGVVGGIPHPGLSKSTPNSNALLMEHPLRTSEKWLKCLEKLSQVFHETH